MIDMLKELSPTELLAMATSFEVLPYRNEYPQEKGKRLYAPFVRQMVVTKTSLPDRPQTWAIYQETTGFNLNMDGQWEYAPMPSSRTDEFLSRCRWPSAIAAIKFAREHLRKYPTGYLPEEV